MRIVIKNGQIVIPGEKETVRGDLAVENGLVISAGGTADTENGEVIDAEGKWVLPGLIDMHVHLREPGRKPKKISAPAPWRRRPAELREWPPWPIHRRSSTVRPYCGMSCRGRIGRRSESQRHWGRIQKPGGKRLSEMGDLAEAGAVAYSDDGHYIENADSCAGPWNMPICWEK